MTAPCTAFPRPEKVQKWLDEEASANAARAWTEAGEIDLRDRAMRESALINADVTGCDSGLRGSVSVASLRLDTSRRDRRARPDYSDLRYWVRSAICAFVRPSNFLAL